MSRKHSSLLSIINFAEIGVKGSNLKAAPQSTQMSLLTGRNHLLWRYAIQITFYRVTILVYSPCNDSVDVTVVHGYAVAGGRLCTTNALKDGNSHHMRPLPKTISKTPLAIMLAYKVVVKPS